MSRQLALAVILLLTLGLLAPAAFTEDDPVPKPKPAEGEKAAEGDTPTTGEKPKEAEKKPDAPKATTTPVVKLLEAGAAPHKQLRYAPSPGTKVEFRSSITSNIESAMGAMQIGPIKMAYLVAAAKGGKDGEFKLALEVTDATMEDDGSMPWAASIKQGLEASKGQKMEGTISTRGIWLGESADGKGAPSELRAQLLSMLPPLPEEAVGVGAKWTVTVQISAGGVTQTSVSTVELTKCEGARIEVAFQEKRAAKDASMTVQGMDVKIPKLSGSGKGTAVIDLALAGTVKASSVVDTEMTMDMMGQLMNNKNKATSTLTGAAPKAVVTDAK